jgi:hypothetical protein
VQIPSIYATKPRTRSLKLIRVSSDQITRRRVSFHFFTDKRQEFIVSSHFSDTLREWNIAAHMRHQELMVIDLKCLC